MPGNRGCKLQMLHTKLMSLRFGNPTHREHFIYYPIFDPNSEPPDYLLLEQVIASGVAHIEEVSESGSVPELKFTNNSPRAVLLMDGETLTGAKQNRAINTTLLAPPNQSMLIPVSCVERGRWSRSQNLRFGTSPQMMPRGMREQRMGDVHRSMRNGGTMRSNQGAVWSSIDDRMHRLHATSRTDDMHDLFAGHEGTLDKMVEGISVEALQSGFAVCVGDRLIGLELFQHDSVLSTLLGRLLRSYAIDLVGEAPTDDTPAGSGQSPEAFVQSLAVREFESFEMVGLGRHLRLNQGSTIASALVHEGVLVHLAAFPQGQSAR